MKADASSLAASPVRLQRDASWADANKASSPFSNIEAEYQSRLTEDMQRTQSALLALHAGSCPTQELRETSGPSSRTVPPLQRYRSSEDCLATPTSSSLHYESPHDQKVDFLGRPCALRSSSLMNASSRIATGELPAVLYNSHADIIVADHDENDAGDILHSINHLRSAGESRRFGDEMHYLLEGLEDSQPLNVHRSRLESACIPRLIL